MTSILTVAVAEIRSSSNGKILGYITLNQKDDRKEDQKDDENEKQRNQNKTYMFGQLKGLPPGEHAIHIHEKGDPRKCCSSVCDIGKMDPEQCCISLGGHYNPFNNPHGDIKDVVRHVGDLGNIVVDKDGTVDINIIVDLVQLSGKYSVVGRSFVIHADRDDGGKTGFKDSAKNGNAGARIAYGIIGYA